MSQLTADQQAEVRDLLADLVRIPSVNMNAEQANRDKAERRVSEFVEQRLVSMGMTVSRHPMAEGRDNLVAHWPDQTGNRSFALQSHMDTVGVDNMTIDPFGGDIRDGKMWGRGTCDTKGSMAAFLTALNIARQQGWKWVDKVYFVATCAEETGCKGAESLMADGFRTDAIVVGEPTMSQLVTAHKGTFWATLESKGRSCHASKPELGHNAVYAMADAIRFIREDYIPSLNAKKHPTLENPTLSVGKISGGTVTNIVPSSCTASLDFRLLPGHDADAVGRDFLERLQRAVPQEEFSLSTHHVQPGVETPSDSPWVRNLLSACNKHTGQSAPMGVTYYTDAGPFSAAGLQCVVFGPGDIAQAHTADEFLELNQLCLATETAVENLRVAASKSLVV